MEAELESNLNYIADGIGPEEDDDEDFVHKDSLLKYENPLMLKNKPENSPRKALRSANMDQSKNASIVMDEQKLVKSSPVQNKVKKDENSISENLTTADILDSLLPPKQWTENDNIWVQKVSSTPATRQDVLNLEKELDKRLNERKAKLAGICPVRRELFHQCFDELIRQVTINCAERGELLLRVRDELICTMHAYETLYESSIAFGLRKALQSEESKKKMHEETSSLSEENKALKKQVEELKKQSEDEEKRVTEQRQADERRHNDEVQFLKRTNQQLKSQIEAIISAKRQ